MKRYRIVLEEQTFEVEILDDPRQERVRVRVNGELLTVEVEELNAPAPAGPQAAAPSPDSNQARTVLAPLPGVVKLVAVRPGQRVSVNDELVVIEAMKMDNVIRAQREGIIGTIHVTVGRQVDHGAPLLDFTD